MGFAVREPRLRTGLGLYYLWASWGFPGGTAGKEPLARAGDAKGAGSIPGLGRSHAEGNGNPLQYYCLENFMDRGAWWATVHGVAESWTRLSVRLKSVT